MNSIKNSILILFISLLVFTSCTKDDPSNFDNQEELTLKDLKFNKLNINFTQKDISKNFKNKKSLKINLLNEIKNINEEIAFRIKKDKNTTGISYTIFIDKNGYLITDWEFQNNNNSNTDKFGDPSDYDSWECPTGSNIVDSCWSQNCVENAIASAMTGFSSGDTVTITIHHGGALGGVTVCASNN